MATHILDHRSHRSRGSESAASAPPVPITANTTASLPVSSGATLVDVENNIAEQRSPPDQVRLTPRG